MMEEKGNLPLCIYMTSAFLYDQSLLYYMKWNSFGKLHISILHFSETTQIASFKKACLVLKT